MATNNEKKGFTIDETAMKLLLVVGGLLVAFLSYQFGYRTFKAKAEDVNEQIVSLSEEVASLLIIQQSIDDYSIKTTTMKEEIDSMLQDIEVKIPPQDRVMFAVAMEKGSEELEVTGMSAGADELLYTMNQGGANPEDNGKALYSSLTTISVHSTYAGLKDALQSLLDSNDKVSIVDASFVADRENGGINGIVNLNMLYLLGSDREYTPYVINGVPTGNDSVFGDSANSMINTGVDEDGNAVENADGEEAGQDSKENDNKDNKTDNKTDNKGNNKENNEARE